MDKEHAPPASEAETATEIRPDVPLPNTYGGKPPPRKRFSAIHIAGKIFNIVFSVALAAFLVFALCALSVSYASQKGLSFLGYRSFIIMSGSMSPAFGAGAYILTEDKPVADIRAGDVISFDVDKNGTIVTHRVKQVVNGAGGLAFITQGDANNVEDFQPVPADQVLGVVFYQVDGLGSVLLSLHNPRNFIFCVLILTLLFFIPDLLRYAFSKDVDKSERDVATERAAQ